MIGNLALLTWLVFSFLKFGSCFFIDGELNLYGFSPYPGDRTTETNTLTVSVHGLVHATASTFTHTSAVPSRTLSVADSISSTAPSSSISGASSLGWHPVAITLTKKPTPHWNYNITVAKSSAKYSSSTTPTLTVSTAESSTREASDMETSGFWQEQSTPTTITALSNNTMISSSADGSRSPLIFSAVMLFGVNLLTGVLL